MTVTVTQPSINVREKLAELDKPTGIAGEAMLRAETPQEQFSLIGAGRRNLIINGGMQVWQRGTSATSAPNGYSTVDRWKIYESSEGAYTSEQSTDHPNGGGYSLKCQVTTADTSIGSSQYAFVETPLEGQDLQQFQYGTSNAKYVTLSFWVKSNKTGTYSVSIYKYAGSGTAYMYRKGYTINSANTWEKKTVTIPPLTSSGGSIPNTSTAGLLLSFGFAWGTDFQGTDGVWDTNTSGYGTSNQVNWMDSTSNNFYLADVQLEVGKVATPFEHRFYGEELALCQRYFWRNTSDGGQFQGMFSGVSEDSFFSGVLQYPVAMRAAPTITWNDLDAFDGSVTTAVTTSRTPVIGTQSAMVQAYTSGGTTRGRYVKVQGGSTSGYIQCDAEL